MSKGNIAIAPVGTPEVWISPLEQTLCEGVQSYLRWLPELEVTRVLGRLCYGQQADLDSARISFILMKL